MTFNKLTARTFGITFLIGYFSYGVGFGLLNSYMNEADSLSTIFNHKTEVIVEAGILMAIFAQVNIVLGILMLPVFKRHNQTLAYGYLSAAIASTVLLIVGAIFLLLSIPLSEEVIKSGSPHVSNADLLFTLCKTANFYSYQIAMVIWGLGGLLFAYLLYISKLVSRWLSVWGIIGYIIFISGAFFAIFGIPIDLLLDIPGGLFEIFLSFLFIFKGFRTATPKVTA